MSQPIIRQAAKGDIARLKEIRFAVKENRLADPARVTDADIEWFIENGPIWTWEENKIILGFSASDPRNGSVWALFVHPDYEGQGIGKSLLTYCCRSLVDAGHKDIKLNTLPNTRAAQFYKMNGWIERGTNDRGEIVLTKIMS